MPPLNFGRIHFTRLYTQRRRSFHQPRRLRSLYSALGTAGHTKKKDFFRGLGVAMTKQYSAFKYLSRIEAAHLDILESKSPIDKTVILWWGLDGLQLNEDGTMKWVSRKKKLSPESVSFQPCQSIQPIQTGMLHYAWLDDQTQCTRHRIEALNAALQQYNVQYSDQYPPYYYVGCCGSYIG